MNTVERIHLKAKRELKTIVLPESEDRRILEAAEIIRKKGLAKVVVLDKDKIDAKLKEKYIQQYYELRKAKGITLDEVRKIFEDSLFYAAMMTRDGLVDGFVAGSAHTTADVVRAALHCLGVDDEIGTVSSCFIMEVPDCSYGDRGTFVYADCGIIPDPSPSQLAKIAISAAQLAQKVLEITPRVALLSYSTKGSARGELIDKVRQALTLAREAKPDLLIDGELQADAAIVPEVSEIKCVDSPLKGNANVLIFPNLEAGNICYKLTQRLARASAIGPLIVGLNKPCSDLSRGCGVDEIVNCVAVTAIRAQSK
ncbi:MAG: phosphate acetyltransferase [Candidatus Omnitrophica bacterium]|nr:phosphate acetyltransferase [Candidatus Omnitrophota bacterium]MDD5237045.1 phosphate acetyltransferase [Candidatus Omnitrophota bacterium]MDD5610234.1 phosphate acetyltransferase [Candidatus Omnitrophota bacterium]